MAHELRTAAEERDNDHISPGPQSKLSDHLKSLMTKALESSQLTLEQVFSKMEVVYVREGKSFIRRKSLQIGRLLEELGKALQGTITCNIAPLTGQELVLPEEDWANQFRTIFDTRPIPHFHIARKMDMTWPSFAAYFTCTGRREGDRPKVAWLVSHFLAVTGYRLVFAFAPDGTTFIPVPDNRGRPRNKNKLRLVHSLKQGENTEAISKDSRQSNLSADCISTLLSLFGVQPDAHSDTSWEALRIAWRTSDSASQLKSAKLVSDLLTQAQNLHDKHDFVGACLLSNIAQRLLGMSGDAEPNA